MLAMRSAVTASALCAVLLFLAAASSAFELKSMVGESANDVHALALAERDENHHSPLFISLLSKASDQCCDVDGETVGPCMKPCANAAEREANRAFKAHIQATRDLKLVAAAGTARRDAKRAAKHQQEAEDESSNEDEDEEQNEHQKHEKNDDEKEHEQEEKHHGGDEEEEEH